MARRYLLILFFSIPGWASLSQCPDFKNVLDRASYLSEIQVEYKSASESERLLIESNFFCAFPNSFQEMEQLFGFDMKTGIAAPLYQYPEGMNTILFFSNLKSIDPDVYYQKYVNINLGGYWQADNIGGSFGLARKFYEQPEEFCEQLAKRTDEELLSVFHFMFDGPHPDQMKEQYAELQNQLASKNKRLGELLLAAYTKLLTEHDGHGK